MRLFDCNVQACRLETLLKHGDTVSDAGGDGLSNARGHTLSDACGHALLPILFNTIQLPIFHTDSWDTHIRKLYLFLLFDWRRGSPAPPSPCTHCTTHTFSQTSSHANAFNSFSPHVNIDLFLTHSVAFTASALVQAYQII